MPGQLSVAILAATLRDVCRNGKRCTPGLRRQGEKLMLRPVSRRMVQGQGDLVRFLPNRQLREVSHDRLEIAQGGNTRWVETRSAIISSHVSSIGCQQHAASSLADG